MFLLSFATVLFTIVLFRLLAFFIMPSLFFDLLFIGFPLGALAGAWFFRVGKAAFLRSLWILLAVMIFSILAMLGCKHFDYLRAHLFDVELGRLFMQMMAFTLFFLPFFCAYGLSEYLGYQIGRRHLRGRMRVVYAVYLFGAAGAYLFADAMFPLLGAGRLLVIPFLLVAVAMQLLIPPTRTRAVLAVAQIAFVALLFAPQLEGSFLRLYKGSSMQSTGAYARAGFETVYQRWGKYSLVEVMQAPGADYYIGFYNDIMQWQYAPQYGYEWRAMGMIPIAAAPAGGHIAIIGSGGGRQVQYAKRSGRDFGKILAVEIEPAVTQAVQVPLAERFGHVYDGENVVVVAREARGYMEQTRERFDLIYLPSVGGYPQMMLEPGNMIRTRDALRTLRERLTERGTLAIWYPSVLDPKMILTEQYTRTLEGDGLGMQVRAFWNGSEYLILAARRDGSHLPTLEEVQRFCLQPGGGGSAPLPYIAGIPVEIGEERSDAGFRPITDDQPFLAGNVRNIFSLGQVGALFALVGGLLALFAFALLFALWRAADPHIPGIAMGRLIVVSLLVGANFLAMEHYLILALFQRLYVYHDALVLAAIGFLVITGLGSMLITPRWRPVCQLLAGLFLLLVVVGQGGFPPLLSLLLLAPVAFVTGSFFPALFETAAGNPLGVFAADAIGAAIGSMAAFFIPIVFGFGWFFAFAAALFWTTAVAVHLFFRDLQAKSPAAVAEGVCHDGQGAGG
jgi:hypothetical protein